MTMDATSPRLSRRNLLRKTSLAAAYTRKPLTWQDLLHNAERWTAELDLRA